MQLTINVDETMFKDVLDNELKALSPEDLKNVMTECIKEYFTANDFKNLEPLIIQETKSRYNWNTQKEATLFATKLIESCDYSQLQLVVDEAIKELQKNYRSILEDILLKTLVQGFTSNYAISSQLEMSVRDIIYRVERERNNP